MRDSWLKLGVASALACSVSGCGRAGSTRHHSSPQVVESGAFVGSARADSSGPASAADSSAHAAVKRSEHAILLPRAPRVLAPNTLPESALAARYVAQAKLLGEKEIFEDARGYPVAPMPRPVVNLDSTLKSELEGELGNDQDQDRDSDSEDDDDDDDDDDESDDASAIDLDELPGSAGWGDAAPGQQIHANGNALGIYVSLTVANSPSSEHPLSHFHDALARLAREPRDARGRARKVRIAAYGASHTQADVYTDYLRTYLQNRFGNGGHGHATLVRTNRWYRYVDYVVENSRHWKVDRAQRRDALPDGHYGLSGASARTRRNHAYARVRPRHPDDEAFHSELYELGYLKQRRGGRFKLLADGKLLTTIQTRKRGQARAAFHDFRLPKGAHTIEVRPVGDGEVRLFGITVERDEPGVVVDTLGISGTRAANHLTWNEASWSASIKQRSPDLFMLAYGTNESTDAAEPIEHYERGLREVLTRFRRAVPKASCVLAGPGDWAQKTDLETWVQPPRLLLIVDVQRSLAVEFNCAYWDALQFMGGSNSIGVWAAAHPQMASKDHIHLTRRGYVRMGMALTDAIMEDYTGPDRWDELHPDGL